MTIIPRQDVEAAAIKAARIAIKRCSVSLVFHEKGKEIISTERACELAEVCRAALEHLNLVWPE